MVDTTPDITEMERKLEDGWSWMKRNPDNSQLEEFFDRWLELLRQYSAVCGVEAEHLDDALPEPSPWIEELRDQLLLDGIADVEQKRPERLQS